MQASRAAPTGGGSQGRDNFNVQINDEKVRAVIQRTSYSMILLTTSETAVNTECAEQRTQFGIFMDRISKCG